MASGTVRNVFLAAIGSLSMASAANAVPYIWTDIYDPADIYLNAPNQHSFTHDIADDGYLPGIDTITGAALTVLLYDDALLGDLPLLGDAEEYVTFSFDGSGWSVEQSVDSILWLPDLFSFSVASLLDGGLVDVVVKAFSGDFYFDKSVLIVTGDRAVAVPEPGALALFGVGLLGLGMGLGARRRRGSA